MIQSVERAIALVDAVAAARAEPQGARELARRTGLHAATAHHLLKTLTDAGWLDLDPETKGYRLGLNLLRLAHGEDMLARLADFAKPYLDRLHARFGETVALLAPRGGVLEVVAWREAIHPLAVQHREREVQHPHRWAAGKALLAYLPAAARDAILAPGLPDGSITRAAVLAELAQVRRDGYAVSLDVAASGIAALGVPVLAGGQALAALGCSAPLARWPAAQRRQVLVGLTEAAGEMSRELERQQTSRRMA